MAAKLPKAAKEYFKQKGAEGGKKSAKKLTKEERRERARLAGIASGKARKKEK